MMVSVPGSSPPQTRIDPGSSSAAASPGRRLVAYVPGVRPAEMDTATNVELSEPTCDVKCRIGTVTSPWVDVPAATFRVVPGVPAWR